MVVMVAVAFKGDVNTRSIVLADVVQVLAFAPDAPWHRFNVPVNLAAELMVPCARYHVAWPRVS